MPLPDGVGELWRPVPDWTGCFASWSGRIIGCSGVERKFYPDKDGYLQLNMRSPGRSRTTKVHRVILETFVGPRPEGLEGRHANGDLTDNWLGNLSWDTHEVNIADQVLHGTHYRATRIQCPQGHDYDEANTRLYQGRRFCRECARTYYDRKKESA